MRIETEAFFMDSSFLGETSRVAKLIPDSRKRPSVVNHFFPLDVFTLTPRYNKRVVEASDPGLFLACAQLRFQDLHSLSQVFQFLAHVRQAPDVGVKTLIFFQRLNRNPPPDTGAYNLAG